jgi:hypothetical protein
MSAKDILYCIGLAVTAALGVANLLYTHRATKRADFIRTVTNERVKWIENLRQNVAAYVARASYCLLMMKEDDSKVNSVVEELDRIAYLIRLQLNPNEEPDKELETLLRKMPGITKMETRQEFMQGCEKVVTLTQTLLKKEWEKVKKEAIKGRL